MAKPRASLVQPLPRVGEMTVGPLKAGLAWRRSDDHERRASYGGTVDTQWVSLAAISPS
jgi:hypothetical protein